MKEFKRFPTIKDIAQEAKVSTTTVLRTIHNNGYVAEKTRQRVLHAIEEQGYETNLIARSLKKRRTHIIGHILVSIFPNPFFAGIAHGVECKTSEQGYEVITCHTFSDAQRERAAIKLLLGRRVDGIIISTPLKKENIYLVKEKGLPLVLVERPVDVPSVDVIVVDNLIGAYEAMEHLISLNHKRIGFIGDKLEQQVENERFEGYRKALKDHGLSFDEKLVKFSKGYSVEEGFRLADELWSTDKFATAVFAACDLLAIGAIQGLRQKGIRVPEDVSVVGYDDTLGMYTSPRLTTVAQPMEEMGQLAAQILIDRIESEEERAPKKIILKTKLIVRNSTRLKSD